MQIGTGKPDFILPRHATEGPVLPKHRAVDSHLLHVICKIKFQLGASRRLEPRGKACFAERFGLQRQVIDCAWQNFPFNAQGGIVRRGNFRNLRRGLPVTQQRSTPGFEARQELLRGGVKRCTFGQHQRAVGAPAQLKLPVQHPALQREAPLVADMIVRAALMHPAEQF